MVRVVSVSSSRSRVRNVSTRYREIVGTRSRSRLGLVVCKSLHTITDPPNGPVLLYIVLLFYYATNAAHKKHTITMSKKRNKSIPLCWLSSRRLYCCRRTGRPATEGVDGQRAGGRAANCTVGQYGYVPLRRHLVFSAFPLIAAANRFD